MVSNSSWKQFSLAATNVTSALEVFSDEMRYINLRFAYLLLDCYLLSKLFFALFHSFFKSLNSYFKTSDIQLLSLLFVFYLNSVVYVLFNLLFIF